MSILSLAATNLPSAGGLIGIFLWVAIAALVIWGIIALVKCSGVPIPQPVWIVLTVVIGIVLIVFLARLLGVAI